MSDTKELPLGILPDKTDKGCSPCCEPGGEEERFPEISFDGKHATLFMEKYGPLSTNDELTITLRTRIKKYSDGEENWDKCVKLSALAVIGDVVEDESPAEENGKDEGEADPKPVRGMKKPAPAKQPAGAY